MDMYSILVELIHILQKYFFDTSVPRVKFKLLALGKLFLAHVKHSSQLSTINTTLLPAVTAPAEKPPMPQKRSIILRQFLDFII